MPAEIVIVTEKRNSLIMVLAACHDEKIALLCCLGDDGSPTTIMVDLDIRFHFMSVELGAKKALCQDLEQ